MEASARSLVDDSTERQKADPTTANRVSEAHWHHRQRMSDHFGVISIPRKRPLNGTPCISCRQGSTTPPLMYKHSGEIQASEIYSLNGTRTRSSPTGVRNKRRWLTIRQRASMRDNRDGISTSSNRVGTGNVFWTDYLWHYLMHELVAWLS